MLTTEPILARRLADGTVVGGKYVIDRQLGVGGFATVYAAHHVEIATLRVAIKVLHAHHAESESTRRRFRREAETAAALQSRFIVRVLDVGETEDRTPFIAMEFVDGMPLDALLTRCGRFAPVDVARFTEGVLRALEVAHAAGVVHRDLKPANVFAVEEDGEHPYARVLDFGIAKVISDANPTAPGTHTLNGQVVCTPQYAAPELLNGHVTPQVDIYALGHMMAELLDGRAPYDIHQNSLLVASEHLRPDPVPLGPHTRASGLEEIVARACAKSPAVRYPNVREMLDDVRRVIPRLRGAPNGATLTLSAPYHLPTQPSPMRPAITGPSSRAPEPPDTMAVASTVVASLPTDTTQVPRRSRAPLLIGAGAGLLVGAVMLALLLPRESLPDAAQAEGPGSEAPISGPPAPLPPAPAMEVPPAAAAPSPPAAEPAEPVIRPEPGGAASQAAVEGSANTASSATTQAASAPAAAEEATPAEPQPPRTTTRSERRSSSRPAAPAAADPPPPAEPAEIPTPQPDPFGNIRVMENQ